MNYLRDEGFQIQSILEDGVFGRSDFGTLVFRDKVDLVGIFYLRPGHFSGSFHISTLKTVLNGHLELTPPFIIVAENTGETVKIRLRSLS